MLNHSLAICKVIYLYAQVAISLSEKWPPERFTVSAIRRLQILLALRRSQHFPAQKLFIVANGGDTKHFPVAPFKLDYLFDVNVTFAWNFSVAEILRLIKFEPS